MAYSYPARPPQPVVVRVKEHRCGICWGPYGKSAIRCPDEPEPITAHERARLILAARARMRAEQ